MSTPVISVDTNPSQEDVDQLGRGLTEHALQMVPVKGFNRIAVFARDEQGALMGGISGLVNWNWLHVAWAWVAEPHRRSGLGSRLLSAFEQAGMERGCTNAHLDTFSYQARPFYERHGYTVYATLEDYPPGHQRYYMRKTLQPRATLR